MTKKIVVKTVARTLVYQLLLIWSGFSVGFIINPEYWGNRAPLVERSIKHIFWPIEYNENVEDFLFSIGRSRIYFELETYEPGFYGLKILEESMASDEYYTAKYKYTNIHGDVVVVDDYRTKINWKPWELDYPLPNEKIADSYDDF